MSFVFLSYSKESRDATQALAAHLQDLGYEVWWDTSLISGEAYAHVIRDKLNAAAAVIVVWTESAVHSEWVYSEAKRARDQRKLVQVHDESLALAEIPPPFDALHLDALKDRAAILRALERLEVPRAREAPAVRAPQRRTQAPSKAQLMEVLVPNLGEETHEAKVVRWLKQPGDTVSADEVIVEIETEKAIMEIEAVETGVLVEVAAREGATVGPGAVLCTIRSQ